MALQVRSSVLPGKYRGLFATKTTTDKMLKFAYPLKWDIRPLCRTLHFPWRSCPVVDQWQNTLTLVSIRIVQNYNYYRVVPSLMSIGCG